MPHFTLPEQGDRFPYSDLLDCETFVSWGKREVTVKGTYEARPGEIIEEQHGGTAKNPDRCCYLILKDSKHEALGNMRSDSRLQSRIRRCLPGRINADELVEKS